MIRNASRTARNVAEPGREAVRENLLADRTERERGQGDPELHRRDEMRRVARDPHHRARGAAALVGELLQPRAAHGHERVLGRDEEAVQQDQNGNGEQLERRPSCPGRRGAGTGGKLVHYCAAV